MALNKKVVNIEEARQMVKHNSVFKLEVYKTVGPEKGYSYKICKGEVLDFSDEIIIFCLSEVFGDMLNYNDNPEVIHEAIESLVNRFYYKHTDEDGYLDGI